MLKKLHRRGLLTIVLTLCMSGLAHGGIEASIVPLAERLAALQSGGHTLVMRHGATDHSQKDLDRGANAPCSMQRDLSEKGRLEMRRLKASVEFLGIQIDKVYSSPYCRAKHTAEEAFGDYEILNDLEFSISKDKAESVRLAKFLCDRLHSTEPGRGNTVFVSHTSNIHDCVGVWPKPEGAAFLLQRQSEKVIYKGMILPSDWPIQGED